MSDGNAVPEATGDTGDVPLYTHKQAVVLGRRSLCETHERGHRLELRVRTQNADGTQCVAIYGCEFCDVRVNLEYPPLDLYR